MDNRLTYCIAGFIFNITSTSLRSCRHDRIWLLLNAITQSITLFPKLYKNSVNSQSQIRRSLNSSEQPHTQFCVYVTAPTQLPSSNLVIAFLTINARNKLSRHSIIRKTLQKFVKLYVWVWPRIFFYQIQYFWVPPFIYWRSVFCKMPYMYIVYII